MRSNARCPVCEGRKLLPDPAYAGARVRAARLRAGVSLRRLAVWLGITPPMLHFLERGARNWTRARFDEAMRFLGGARERQAILNRKAKPCKS